MRKLEIADAGVMRIAIQQEMQRSEESRYDHRLHGLLMTARLAGDYRRAKLSAGGWCSSRIAPETGKFGSFESMRIKRRTVCQ